MTSNIIDDKSEFQGTRHLAECNFEHRMDKLLGRPRLVILSCE